MIRIAREGSTTWFVGLPASAIPHPLPSGIRVHLRASDVGLEVQGLAGTLPLTNGDTLSILPKIEEVNFLRLLFRVQGMQKDLEREYEDFVQYALAEGEGISTLVGRTLLRAAAEIMTRSPQQGRVKRLRVSTFSLGQMDVIKTAINVAQRLAEPVVSYEKQRTVDIPENRVITEAVTRVWPLLSRADQIVLQPTHDRWLQKFPRARSISLDIFHVESGFATGRYGGARDYYRNALMLAQVVLGTQGLGLPGPSSVAGDAFLLNTADIFEKYVRTVIAEAYSSTGVIVSKGWVGTASLYTDGSFELSPDIVISLNSKTVLIADAKYKTPTADDHYQLHAYLNADGSKCGVLLSPAFASNEVEVRDFITPKGRVVYEISLPMDNLQKTEDFLSSIISRLP